MRRVESVTGYGFRVILSTSAGAEIPVLVGLASRDTERIIEFQDGPFRVPGTLDEEPWPDLLSCSLGVLCASLQKSSRSMKDAGYRILGRSEPLHTTPSLRIMSMYMICTQGRFTWARHPSNTNIWCWTSER